MFLIDRKTVVPHGLEGNRAEEFTVLGATANGQSKKRPSTSQITLLLRVLNSCDPL